MNGPYAEEYWEAAQLEIETLEKIKAWTVVPCTDEITCLPPGLSKFKDTQMGLSRSSRVVSVLVATNKSKALTSLRPTAQLCNGLLFV